jgi:hypothetical protein
LALDDIVDLAEIYIIRLNLADNVVFLTQVLDLLLDLSQEASAVVVDPIYSLPLLLIKHSAGSLDSLRTTSTSKGNKFFPQLFPNFSLLEIKNNYALAKLAIIIKP